MKNSCALKYDVFFVVLPKAQIAGVEQRIMKPETVAAPIEKGDAIGSVGYYIDGKAIGQVSLTASEEIAKIGFFDILGRMLARFALI